MAVGRGLWGNRGFLTLLTVQTSGFFAQSLLRLGVLAVALPAGESIAAGLDGRLILIHVLAMLAVSAFGGILADRQARPQIIRRVKLAEVGVSLAVCWFLLQRNLTGLVVCVVLLGLRDGLAEPAIRASLPDYVRKTRLAQANGVILASMLGASFLAAMIIVSLDGTRSPALEIVAGLAVAGSLAGLVASLLMPALPAACPDLPRGRGPWAATRDLVDQLRVDRYSLLAGLGIGWFWMHLAIYWAYLPGYAQAAAGGASPELLVGALAAGSIAGALLMGPLSGRRVEVGLVPLGAIGLAAGGLYLYLAAPDTAGAAAAGPGLRGTAAAVCLAIMGVASSFYVLPLYAVLQERLPRRQSGRAFGAVSIFTGLFVSFGLLAGAWLSDEGLSPSAILIAGSLVQAVAAVYVFAVIPEFLIRLVMWLVTNTLYRVRQEGLHYVPAEGPALLVCNHVSFMDALVIGGSIRRPVRFVMHKYIFQIPGINLLFRWFKTIPIASAKDDPETLSLALDRVAAELESGRVVCIFPEGRLTRDGEIGEFRSGAIRIIERTPVPVVPMALSGLWGSFFSNCGGPAMKHWPRWPFYRVELRVGPSLAPEGLTADRLSTEVQGLRGPDR